MTTTKPRHGRTITCRNTTCGIRSRNAGHGYCNACYIRWTAAGRPAEGPPPRRPQAERDARKASYQNARQRDGLGIKKAARHAGISLATAYRYEREDAAEHEAAA